MRTDGLLGIALALTTLLVASSAGAYCRTTTCDASGSTNCAPDANGCSTEGTPLFWPSRCVDFGVQKDGSPKLGITYAQANQAILTGYQQWLGVTCGTASPSFKFFNDGQIACSEPQYNPNGPNANVWMFRDASWPYKGASSTLALTTVTFAVKTGEILDADVELNSFGAHFTVADTGPGTDLQSIATHESGHFLGLAHSNDASASMYPQYVSGDRSFRTLSPDDEAGICAAYPPNRAAPDCTAASVVGGFSRDCAKPPADHSCSCRVAESSHGSPAGLAALCSVAFALAHRRRRRAR